MWEERWRRSEKGAWTRKLIKDVRKWINRGHGELNYHMTQALSGHGCFGEYLHRFKKRSNPQCQSCGEPVDSVEHALFKCERFRKEREEIQMDVRVENMIELMIESEEAWKKIEKYITTVMREKERIEREIQEATTGL
ncbi:hypothetical protein M8J77_011081 [Diaphorina citri]|nr:hypothetical protein M8J77_011081 [Diaphorina citri]